MAELEWFAHNKIDLLYNADANFAMYDRDVALTKYMTALKRQFGYPNKFRAAYAKNSGDRVYQVGKILNDAQMCKGVTLSFQSMDESTLEAVKRKNIAVDVFKSLMRRYREENIPTYSELIIGLPGETYDTFADGLQQLMDCGQHSSINCYTCEVLPNSELNDAAYRARYAIESVVTPQIFYHASVNKDAYREDYEIVIGTNTLSEEDWLRCELLACFVQALHCLGLTQIYAIACKAKFKISYRAFYEALLREAEESQPRGVLGSVYAKMLDFYRAMRAGKTPELVDLRFGDVSWPPEEYAFLQCVLRTDRLYYEVWSALERSFATVDDGYGAPTFAPDERRYLFDVDLYQREAMKLPSRQEKNFLVLSYDVVQIVEDEVHGRAPDLSARHHVYQFEAHKNYDRYDDYAREVVWYGRKGGTLLRAPRRAPVHAAERTDEQKVAS